MVVDDSYDPNKITIIWAGKVQITVSESSKFVGEYEYDTSLGSEPTKIQEVKYANSNWGDFPA